jgi:hypothetical protein
VEILPVAEREGIGMIGYSPMAHGLLSGAMTRERIAALPAGDWRRHSEELREPQLTKHLELVERLRLVAARHDTTPGAVAVAWTLRNPATGRSDRGGGEPHAGQARHRHAPSEEVRPPPRRDRRGGREGGRGLRLG